MEFCPEFGGANSQSRQFWPNFGPNFANLGKHTFQVGPRFDPFRPNLAPDWPTSTDSGRISAQVGLNIGRCLPTLGQLWLDSVEMWPTIWTRIGATGPDLWTDAQQDRSGPRPLGRRRPPPPRLRSEAPPPPSPSALLRRCAALAHFMAPGDVDPEPVRACASRRLLGAARCSASAPPPARSAARPPGTAPARRPLGEPSAAPHCSAKPRSYKLTHERTNNSWVCESWFVKVLLLGLGSFWAQLGRCKTAGAKGTLVEWSWRDGFGGSCAPKGEGWGCAQIGGCGACEALRQQTPPHLHRPSVRRKRVMPYNGVVLIIASIVEFGVHIC